MTALASASQLTRRTRPSIGQRWNALVYDPFLLLAEARGMRQRRRQLLDEAAGRVLEIGAGTGLNVPHYGRRVDELVLTEPDRGMVRHLQRRVDSLGRRTDAAGPATASVVPAPAEALPFPDASFDTAVTTMVLCTVPDPAAAIRELRRVLRPGGRLLLIEHVRADHSPTLARWQHRLRQPWKSFAAGCRADQDTTALLADAGWGVQALDAQTWHGMPFIVHPLLVGALEVPGPSR
ncbi:MAG: class I SAM-dependent methyltransferase [Dermatophilaceae bacterium]